MNINHRPAAFYRIKDWAPACNIVSCERLKNGKYRIVKNNGKSYFYNEIINTHEGEHLEILFEYPLRELVYTTEGLSEDEKTYAGRSWTHVDFILCDRTTKRPILAIEVDGYSKHHSEERKLRDGLKDHILETNGIRFRRFSTKGSDEEERLVTVLKEADPFYKEKWELNRE